METIINNYEIVMIFSVAEGEEPAKALAERFTKMIEENGTMNEVEAWGRRRLAYPIEDELEGYYILAKFSSETDFPAEIERVLGITDGVLRSMVIRLADVKEAKEEDAVVVDEAKEEVVVVDEEEEEKEEAQAE